MYRLFYEKDCSLVEINPLALMTDGSLEAIDAKMVFDDSALGKHPDIEELRNREEYSRDELDAITTGLSFVGLDGTIGCMVNGAGLAMATADMIKHFGESPANFMDVGGSSSPAKVMKAFEILLRNQRIKVILINIFGGITRCDDVARGILMASEQLDVPIPLVVRLVGTSEDEGRNLLGSAGIPTTADMTVAVKKAIDCARNGA